MGMVKSFKIVLIDDDPFLLKWMGGLLERHGHSVISYSASREALDNISHDNPDCVVTDLMMPEIDGLEVVKQLREDEALSALKIIVVSSKTYEFDKNRALSFGADGYIFKTTEPAKFMDQINKVLMDPIEMTFWGVHGTLPVPGQKTVRYGGNTSCMTLDFPKEDFFIFDAGSGIKALSDSLLAKKRSLTKSKIFISHPHWDHINAFPFFVPLFIQGNDFEVCGPSHGDIDMEKLISDQMDGVYFPINIKEFSARVRFRDLREETLELDGIQVQTMLLNHPGYCLGYRVEYHGKVICYITDNELYPRDSEFYNDNYVSRLLKFCKNADVLVTDTCYMDEEYERKVNWGHSAPKQVCDLAHRAGVKKLFLFHHDPAHHDDKIDEKLQQASQHLAQMESSTQVIAPREGETFEI